MNKPIRILHCVVGSMNVGGIEDMLMELYRNIDRNKVQFDFLVHDYNENYYEKEIKELGGIIHRIPYISKRPLKHILEFRSLLKNCPEYKIIHIHTTYSIMLTDALEAKQMGRKVIIHSHNSNANFKRTIIHKILKTKFSKCADYRIACSDIAGRWMFSKKYLNDVIFWPNAKKIEKYKFSNEIREKIRKSETTENAFIVGNIGRLSYQKNQELLIDIFSEILKKKPNSVLWLIGDGEDRKKLENMVKEKDLEEKVKFWGNVKNVNELLFAIDVFVLTSRYEGLGIVLIEAQATGVPLVIPSYIPKEACIDENIRVIKKVNNIDEWVKKILDTTSKNIILERERKYELILKSDFNISNWINKVENFYLTIEKENQ